ncbi:MAG: tetratricopeptide repeat protein [Planctomycetes bacterium]|nr:tetratricopeptide repeat protein [Planctomycetota bacterium]
MSTLVHCAGSARRFCPTSSCALLTIMLVGCLSGCQWAAVGQNVEGVRDFNSGNYPAAETRFRQAMASDPANPDSYYNLARVYDERGMKRNNQDDLDQAERLYGQALGLDRNHRDAHRGLAVLLVKRGEAEEAEALLEDWIEQSPSLADAKVELARLKSEFGQREAAIGYLTDALEDDPNHHCALTALGTMREAMGDHKQALACYQRSLRSNRFQPQVQNRVASLQRALAPAAIVTPAGATRLVEVPASGPALR